MPTKIFVGRLAEGTTSDDLRALFRKFGTVTECDVITNYGFVHMDTEAEASAAIAALDGYSVKGNHISVEMSTARTQGRKRRTTDTFRGNGKGPSARYDPYQPRRDTYGDAGLARPAMDSRAMDRDAYQAPREEYASEQVKDLLELYFRDRNAFDQYARTYYYGERSERAARSYYDAKVADDYPVASHR